MINHKLFRDIIFVLAVLFILSFFVSCGADDIVVDRTESLAAVLESASPPDGGDLAADGSITLTFDKNPGDVTASAGTVSGVRKTRTITGPFTIGDMDLTLEWSNGRKSFNLNYNVLGPLDTTIPTIMSSTIKDGDEAVNPEAINKKGIIGVHFNKLVTGKISLERSKDGLDLCWSSEINSPSTSLVLVYDESNDNCRSQLLDYETAYVIHGKVSDAAGNETEVNITFTTKAHEDPTVGGPIITIVFKADDFNHFNPDIWAYQLHTDGLLKKNVFVAVAYTVVFDGGALDHWDGWGLGSNKWRVEGNTITQNDLVFIPKHATFSKILPSPFPFGRQERKHINYFSIEILSYVPGWEKYFWNNPFKMIGVSGDGPLFINVGQITPTYAVGNPSKAELLR